VALAAAGSRIGRQEHEDIMAKQTVAATEAKVGPITQLKDFYREVLNEMSKVTWPSKDELKSSTQVVLVMLFLFAAVIKVYDVVFQFIIMGLFNLSS